MEEATIGPWTGLRQEVAAAEMATILLERLGCEVLDRVEEPGAVWVFAKDEGCLVVASVEIDAEGEGDFPEPRATRAQAERAAYRFLCVYDGDDAPLRLDAVQLKPTKSTKCMVRRITNAFKRFQ